MHNFTSIRVFQAIIHKENHLPLGNFVLNNLNPKMKNSFLLPILLTLLLFSSCMVTRSRYGNGIRIELPERFTNSKSQTQETLRKRQVRTPKKSSQVLTYQTISDSLAPIMDSVNKPSPKLSQAIQTIPKVCIRQAKKTIKRIKNGKHTESEQLEKNHTGPDRTLESKQSKLQSSTNSGEFGEIVGEFFRGLLIALLILGILLLIIIAFIDFALFLEILLTLALCFLLSMLGLDAGPMFLCG